MSFLFGGYRKLPKGPLVKPFSSTNNPKMHHLDDIYSDLSEQWDSDRNEAMHRKKSMMREGNASSRSFINYAEQSAVKKLRERREREAKRRGNVLAQKMKELEMMDVNDVDHVLDIKEVVHYYSLLSCPVYLDLVDEFFMDLYSEFFLPQPSVSVNNSMRRLGPVKL